MKQVTLNDQILVIEEMIKSLAFCNDDVEGAYQQCKSAIAECELLLDMLQHLKSDLEYDILDTCEIENYWDI